ncbi:GntR family transcriptional regulator [Gallaecimonas xiamenensis]|uniref:GntR family transcriptional regulator n=1 Tax=Gallaecimonas xiamenensis 3-C-1 TaxID=745411 RepID=K2J1L8_9GAMM|nr:GntR family transcriptional regulator [Gallaecimonas xiamenensis]EKE68682.1 GntR family transcriptional regulator [Gallaecimonas xiamenensis 3-C-1]
MTQKPPVVHKTRTSYVLDSLRDRILSGELKAGEPLRQNLLAESLNVSRIPVREAMMQLEAEGLIDFEAHKGARVTPLSVEQAEELFDIRLLLEPDLLARSIPHLTALDLHQSQGYLLQMDAALKQGSIQDWAGLNRQFHLSLYAGAQRPRTLELVETLNTHADRYVRLHLLLDGGVQRAEGEHEALLACCRDQRIDEAVERLKVHIRDAKQDVINMILAGRHV